MKKIITTLKRLFGIAKYHYYVIVLKEKYSMPDEVPGVLISSNFFYAKRAAQVYANWLKENSQTYEPLAIESFSTDTPYAYAELTYPRSDDEKMLLNYVMPD